MKILRLNEYHNQYNTSDEEEYKNELVSLNMKYSNRLSAQVMADWLEVNIDIMRAKAKLEKNK